MIFRNFNLEIFTVSKADSNCVHSEWSTKSPGCLSGPSMTWLPDFASYFGKRRPTRQNQQDKTIFF